MRRGVEAKVAGLRRNKSAQAGVPVPLNTHDQPRLPRIANASNLASNGLNSKCLLAWAPALVEGYAVETVGFVAGGGFAFAEADY